MENPAHVYTTGIPMSEKGNFVHNKYGCDEGESLDDVPLERIPDHNYPNNSNIILCDSTSENVEYINSIQDGFQQSEILCGFVCNAGDLQSDDLRMENSSMEVECIPESDAHIKFPDSPASSFSCKIESFPSIDGLVQGFDEQIDNYLLTDFQKVNKSHSDDGTHSLEEEQRTVTEAISAIAKSFGLEDLLPENFQVDGLKDLPMSVPGDSLCGSENDHIGEISLVDFEKCSALHSPGSSLDLGDQLPGVAQAFELNGLEMLASPSQTQCVSLDNSICEKYTSSVKGEDKYYINIKEDYNFKHCNDSFVPVDNVTTQLSFENSLIEAATADINAQSAYKFEQPDPNCTLQNNNVCEINENPVCDIPTVRITDVEAANSSEMSENCSSAGTVLITRDKASKKMQIVLTLDQGQQIFDIDTESIDANEQSLDLDLQTSLNHEQLQIDGHNSIELNDVTCQDLIEYSADLESEKSDDFPEEEETTYVPSTFVELVSDIPVTVTKGRKGKTWICPVEECGLILDKESKLRVHMLSHKGGTRPFKCDFHGCDWAFTTPYRLRRHAETHLGSKDFICDFEGCNRKFTTVYNLKTHSKRHKWPNSLTCPSKDCKMSFANRRKLELHLRVHNDVEAPYKCGLCGKQYYSANCIASHYRTHQYNEDDFKCPFQGCGKVYDKICRLKQHIRHHTGDRPYVCPAEGCKWSFMSASKLTRHMRKHTGERKFTCTEPGCGKSFMRPEHLKGHVVIHSGDKPFHCPHENCNARFTAKSSLYVHVKKHCPSVLKVVYPCPVASCVKKYNSKATLKQHLQKFHPETMGEGKELNIAEKLELTMPVSLVNQNENSSGYLELEDGVADDPSTDLQLQLFQSTDLSLQNGGPSFSLGASSGPVKVSAVDTSNRTVPKASKNKSQNNQFTFSFGVGGNPKNNPKAPKISEKLMRENHSGCARTDYCCNNFSSSKRVEQQMTFMSLNQNSNDNHDTRSYLSNSQMSTEIKSPNLMLASSIIFHDQCSEQLMKPNFLHDDCSTSHSLYHDDSILASGSTFETELIPVSLLSDGVESGDESVLNHSGVVFSEQNSVDAFAESIHLHDLD